MEPDDNKARGQLHGVGVGLRACHYQTILKTKPTIAWFEILSDNYLVKGGSALYHLDQICERYPVAMHSVGMSIGASDPLNLDYFKQLKQLAARVKPAIISDHLCWISNEQQYYHELLPLPYTSESIKHIVGRIKAIQELLGRQILIENVSSYLSYKDNSMTEWEFIDTIAELADCFILLDINNIYVSATNHDFLAEQYINAINPARVKQFHLAGYEDHEHYLLDSHSERVHQQVWDLYKLAVKRFGQVPTLIEWDKNIPEFNVLEEEAARAEKILTNQ